MNKPLHLDKAHFFRWVVKQPPEKSTYYLFEDYMDEIERNSYDMIDIKDYSPLSFNDVDSIENDLVFSALARNKFETCGELSCFIFDKDILANIDHPNAERIVWESFAKRFENNPDASKTLKTITVYFDGSNDNRVVDVISFNDNGVESDNPLKDTPLISPLYGMTWGKIKKLNFTEAFQTLFLDKLIEDIPYDWYNKDGGHGTIKFRFNPDPDILFDIAYEGYKRYTTSTLEWKKDFDYE